MLNVCFFAGDITRNGGTERVATRIANGLSYIGKYRICFLSLVEQNTKPFYTISQKIRRSVLKEDRKWVSPGIGYLPFIISLRQFLKENCIDIIIDVDLVLDLLSIPAALGVAVRIVSWEHFNYFFERNIWYRRCVLLLSSSLSDYIVTLTERDRQNYQALTRRRKRITAIDNPVDLQEAAILPKEKILITVGQLIYRKGIDMLAQLIPRILRKYGDWRWYFLGEGEYRKILEDVRISYGLKEQLILTGVVTNVESYLRRASIMVLGSREEGLGMCLLEARACHVPCIAFDIPVGPLELIAHGVNGFLIPPFDLKDMEEKISILIEDDTLRERFMANTTAGIEKFQLNSVLQKWTRLLDTVSSS